MDTTNAGTEAARIVLDLVPDAQPIHGSLTPEDGPPRTFTGWLELTRVLERLISEAAGRQAPPEAQPAP